MPAERKVFNRKIFKLGALAASPFLLAACQNVSTEQKTPLSQTTQITPSQHLATAEPNLQPIKTETPKKTSTRITTTTPPSEIPTPQANKDSLNPVNLEPYVDKFGSLINTVIRGNYTYTYKLIQNADPNLGIPNVRGLISDPKLYAYISDPEKRARIMNLYQQALDKNIANPNDPEIPQLILDASMVIKDVCTTDFHKTITKGNASMIYFKDPKFWQDNQFAIIDSNCFWGEKTTQ